MGRHSPGNERSLRRVPWWPLKRSTRGAAPLSRAIGIGDEEAWPSRLGSLERVSCPASIQAKGVFPATHWPHFRPHYRLIPPVPVRHDTLPVRLHFICLPYTLSTCRTHAETHLGLSLIHLHHSSHSGRCDTRRTHCPSDYHRRMTHAHTTPSLLNNALPYLDCPLPPRMSSRTSSPEQSCTPSE